MIHIFQWNPTFGNKEFANAIESEEIECVIDGFVQAGLFQPSTDVGCSSIQNLQTVFFCLIHNCLHISNVCADFLQGFMTVLAQFRALIVLLGFEAFRDFVNNGFETLTIVENNEDGFLNFFSLNIFE